MKYCPKCRIEKNLKEFSKSKNRKDKLNCGGKLYGYANYAIVNYILEKEKRWRDDKNE